MTDNVVKGGQLSGLGVKLQQISTDRLIDGRNAESQDELEPLKNPGILEELTNSSPYGKPQCWYWRYSYASLSPKKIPADKGRTCLR